MVKDRPSRKRRAGEPKDKKVVKKTAKHSQDSDVVTELHSVGMEDNSNVRNENQTNFARTTRASARMVDEEQVF